MTDFALPQISVAPALFQARAATAQPSATATGDETSKRAKVAKASQDFESSFLSVMIGQMFEGVSKPDSLFGGGAGEQAFQSFMSDAMAKQMVRSGGVGLAASVQKEMLKLQGLS